MDKKSLLYIALGSIATLSVFYLGRKLFRGGLGRKNRKKIRFVWL
jgi:hypothetical protein